MNHVVKTPAQKKSFDLTETSTKQKESWITSSKIKTDINNFSEKEDKNEVENNLVPSKKNDDSSDELNSHQASSSSQKSSKPGSDILTPEADDSMFQDFLSESPLVISEEPEVRLKIQLSKKTDFKGEDCGSVEPLTKVHT